jgi:2-deoxy-D-gluconate 3-dehydrogenase
MASAASAAVDISKLFSLEGKTAIVTGGTGGLGTAMTTALASGGADIISIELPNDPGSANTEKIVTQTCGKKYKKYECDVRDLKAIRATYQKMWSDGVVADIVLNCAGVQRRAEAVDFTDDDIDAVIDINVKATLVSCQEFAKKLLGMPKRLSIQKETNEIIADGRPGKVISPII